MILGIDVGTTAIKAMLVNPEGRGLFLAQRPVDLLLGVSNHVEQDPGVIWSSLVEAVREAISNAGNPEVQALSLSVQGGTLIPLDGAGNPMGNAIAWMDQRGRPQAEVLSSAQGKEYFHMKTGWAPMGSLPLFTIAWLREERPEYFDRVVRFAFLGDYLVERLCGHWVADPTSAGMTMLYNPRSNEWDEDLLEMAGIEVDQLPPLMDPGEEVGRLTPEARRELGMERGEVIVANPGHDQYCASLGAGAMEEGRMLISGGTAWVVLLTTREPIFGATGLPAPGRHLEAGKWGLMSAFPTAGVSVDWFRNALCGAGDPGYTRQLELEAKSIPPGSNGVIFLPYFTGSSAPTWSTGMRGSVLGLTLKHSRAHVFRALLEGVGYDVLWKIESYRDVGARLESIRMIGGATRSLNWPGIVSNMLGVPIQVPRIEESAALGAVILAGKAAGAFGGLEEGASRLVSVGSTYQPDPETNAMYRGLFPCYQRAFEDVRGALEPIPSRR